MPYGRVEQLTDGILLNGFGTDLNPAFRFKVWKYAEGLSVPLVYKALRRASSHSQDTWDWYSYQLATFYSPGKGPLLCWDLLCKTVAYESQSVLRFHTCV